MRAHGLSSGAVTRKRLGHLSGQLPNPVQIARVRREDPYLSVDLLRRVPQRILRPARDRNARAFPRQRHGDAEQRELEFPAASEPVLGGDEYNGTKHVHREQESDNVHRDAQQNEDPTAHLDRRREVIGERDDLRDLRAFVVAFLVRNAG